MQNIHSFRKSTNKIKKKFKSTAKKHWKGRKKNIRNETGKLFWRYEDKRRWKEGKRDNVSNPAIQNSVIHGKSSSFNHIKIYFFWHISYMYSVSWIFGFRIRFMFSIISFSSFFTIVVVNHNFCCFIFCR